MRKLGIEKWIIRLVQAMYADATSSVRINNTFSKKFGVKVGVHQGSVLSPLLFVIVMEALSQDCQHGCPWELLYADDLVIMNESLEGLVNQFTVWKDGFSAKGLRVNMSKSKVLISNPLAEKQVDPSKHPCG